MITKEIMEKLWYAQTWMGHHEFFECFKNKGDEEQEIYGLARHLWDKYMTYNYNLLKLWRALDIINQGKLVKYLNSHDFDKKYKKAMRIQ